MRLVNSPNCDARPAGSEITLVVLHSISLPPGEYGGDAIERFFTNRLESAGHPYFQQIASLKVSSHFLIRRDGEVVQFVAPEKRAWHAGVSSWRGRERCNDFSVGIELEGTDDTPFEEAQYRSLVDLLRSLKQQFPLRDIAGHSDVAPGRKTDPGARFDWLRLLAALSSH
jgi:N-acetyl-anhydromuramoyl-L-alanine amidase